MPKNNKTKTTSTKDGVTTKIVQKKNKRKSSTKIVKRKNGKLISKSKESLRIKGDDDDLIKVTKTSHRKPGIKSKSRTRDTNEGHKSVAIIKEENKKRKVYKSQS